MVFLDFRLQLRFEIMNKIDFTNKIVYNLYINSVKAKNEMVEGLMVVTFIIVFIALMTIE